MPDTLNKQAIVNLLIDSPLREPIKINLIDIVNNTSEPDLPKVYSTITKELEIFQKATERRMKLAEETIAKLGGVTPAVDQVATPAPVTPTSLPPLDLPPLPTPPTPPLETPVAPSMSPLSVPPLDLPPLPASPNASLGGPTMPSTPPAPTEVPAPTMPAPQPLGGAPASTSTDEDALAEIQKELDSLKTATSQEVAAAAAPSAV